MCLHVYTVQLFYLQGGVIRCLGFADSYIVVNKKNCRKNYIFSIFLVAVIVYCTIIDFVFVMLTAVNVIFNLCVCFVCYCSTRRF